MASSTELHALIILRDHGPLRPREFARLMWPNAEGWHRSSRGGHGSIPGSGMVLAGGGYLGRLSSKGLIQWSRDGYRLTDGGRALLG